MVAGMDVGDEALDPVGDEFDRPLEQLRQRHRRHLVGVGVHLDAERAADVLGDDADLVFFQREVLGEQVLHHVRRLRALIDREARFARIPVGDDGARLVGDAGVAAEHERGFDHGVGLGEALVGIARGMDALEAEIVADRRMDHRRLRIERSFRIGDRLQFFVIHRHQFAAVLGLGAGAGDHGADRFASPAGAIDGDGVLRRGFKALEVCEHPDPGRDDLRQFCTGDDGDDARRCFRRCCVDTLDPRMRVRGTDVGHMRHARQHHIADILRAALRQAREVGPRHRAADVGIRPVERGEERRRVVDDFHGLPPARACATDSIASTMAW